MGRNTQDLLKTMSFPSRISYSQDTCVLRLAHTAASPSHILPSIWKMGQRGSANPLKLHYLCLFFFALFMWWGSCDQESKFEDQVRGRQQLATPPSRLPASVLTEDCCTQSMKSVDSGGQEPAWWALPSLTGPGRKEQLSQQSKATGAMKR